MGVLDLGLLSLRLSGKRRDPIWSVWMKEMDGGKKSYPQICFRSLILSAAPKFPLTSSIRQMSIYDMIPLQPAEIMPGTALTLSR